MPYNSCKTCLTNHMGPYHTTMNNSFTGWDTTHTYAHKNTHIDDLHRINFKKPSMCQPVASTHLVWKHLSWFNTIPKLSRAASQSQKINAPPLPWRKSCMPSTTSLTTFLIRCITTQGRARRIVNYGRVRKRNEQQE